MAFTIFYFTYKSGFGFLIVSGLLLLFGVYSLFSNLMMFNLSSYDLDEKIKISTMVIVKKRELKENRAGDNMSVAEYILHLDGDDNISIYHVKKKHFNMLTVDDEISLEYSKHAHWILSITWNNIDIENKSYIK